MANAAFHVCNETREAPICKRVELLDTAQVPFNSLVKRLTQVSEAGLLLRPFWGVVPRVPGVPPVEILLLSQELKVLECLAELPSHGVGAMDSRITCALILPAASIASGRVKAGDQIRICDAASRVAWDCHSDNPPTHGSRCRCFVAEPDPKESNDRDAQVQSAISALQAAQASEEPVAVVAKKKSFGERIVRWITGYDDDGDRRRGTRQRFPKLVAYYWTGGTPKAFSIGDIGPSGFYVITEDRWLVGTRIMMTLQRTDLDNENAENSVTVASTVIHSGTDGVGFAFVLTVSVDPASGEMIPANKQNHEKLMRFVQGVLEEGQPATPVK
jgi:hypothetical protein